MPRNPKHGHKTLLIKLFMLFSSFVILPTIILGSVFYLKSMNDRKREVLTANERTLRFIRSNLDGVFNDAERDILTVALNSNLRTALSLEKDPEARILKLKEIQTVMGDLYHTSPHADAFLIRFADSGKILTHDGYYGDETVSEYSYWPALLHLPPDSGTTRLQTPETGYFVFLKNLPMEGGTPKARVYYVLDASSIRDELRSRIYSESVEFILSDSEGRILLSSSAELQNQRILDPASAVLDLSGVRYYSAMTPSLRPGWTYRTLVREADIRSMTRPILTTVILICSFLTAAGLLLSYLLSKRFYNPIGELVEYVEQTIDGREETETTQDTHDRIHHDLNEIAFINVAMHRMVESGEKVKRLLDRGTFAVKHALFHSLFQGAQVDDSELRETLAYLKIPCSDSYYTVVGVETDRTELIARTRQQYLKRLAVMEAAERIFTKHEMPCITVTYGADRVFVILFGCRSSESTGGGKPTELPYTACRNLSKDIRDRNDFTVTIGIGSTVDDLQRIRESYTAAVRALDRKLLAGKDSIIDIRKINIDDAGIYIYPLSGIEKIVNALRAADLESAIELIRRMFDDLRHHPDMPVRRIRYALIQLLSFTSQAVVERGYTFDEIFGPDFQLMTELESRRTITDIETWIIAIFTQVIEFQRARQAEGHRLSTRAMRYMERNFKNPISLNDTAETLGISPQYLSRRFKQETGEKYVDYLNNIRLRHVVDLLMESNLTLSEIADRTGFGNYQYMIKKFKQKHGVTPAQYRESRKKESVS